MRPEDRERILTEVESRLVEEKVAASESGGLPLEEVLAESIYHERRRLKDEPKSRVKKADQEFWGRMYRRLNHCSDRERRDLLRQVIRQYATQVCGNFNERVYRMTTSVLPPALGLLLNTVSPRRLLRGLNEAPRIEDTIIVQGEIEHLRTLHEIGTVILTPTHVSNLDSIILGFAILQMGLPPFVYGAGLNLFTNPMLGFFMSNLGAYTVDRKKRDPLYKEVLKTYAGLTLEFGYDNLFFPGGTRARSGAIEKKLKLGLLGTSISAYVHNLRRGAPNPNIYIVPATLSFQLCLEAETLVEDFLKEVGKSRYIITDDEFSRPGRVWDFVSRLFSLDSKIYVTVGRGLDPFGNPVGDDGVSFDPRGRSVDISRYVLVDGEPQMLRQRDIEYTTEAGRGIADSFMRNNVIQSTHVTARAVFALLRRANPNVDLLRLIRLGPRQDDVSLRDLYRITDQILDELRGLEKRSGIRLSPLVRSGSASDIVTDGLQHFGIYHGVPAARRRGDRVFAQNRMLLFYYQNRLEGYRLDRTLGTSPVLSNDHLTLRAA